MLYSNPKSWETKQALIQQSLAQVTANRQHQEGFIQYLGNLLSNLETHRNISFIGQILQSQQHRVTRYMSLWVEGKNRK